MLRILGNATQCCDGITRRTFLRAGGLGALALANPGLSSASEAKRPRTARANRPNLGELPDHVSGPTLQQIAAAMLVSRSSLSLRGRCY